MIDAETKKFIDQYVCMTAAQRLYDDPWQTTEDGRVYKTRLIDVMSDVAERVYNYPVDYVGEPMKKDLTEQEIVDIKGYVWGKYML